MKLPRVEHAVVRRAKIVEYLLAEGHPTGHGKAGFFGSLGFRASAWEDLAQVLHRHALENDVVTVQDTEFGTRYVVEGPLSLSRRGRPYVRTVWFADRGAGTPRLITAYPIPEAKR